MNTGDLSFNDIALATCHVEGHIPGDVPEGWLNAAYCVRCGCVVKVDEKEPAEMLTKPIVTK